jgi:hypothetical protein
MRLSDDFAHPLSYVRGPLSVGAISYKVWETMNQFPNNVHTSGSGLIFIPILMFPILLTHCLEISFNGGMNY